MEKVGNANSTPTENTELTEKDIIGELGQLLLRPCQRRRTDDSHRKAEKTDATIRGVCSTSRPPPFTLRMNWNAPLQAASISLRRAITVTPDRIGTSSTINLHSSTLRSQRCAEQYWT